MIRLYLFFVIFAVTSSQCLPSYLPFNLNPQFAQIPSLTIQRYLSPSPLFHFYQLTNSSYPALLNANYIKEEDVGRVAAAPPNETNLCPTPLVSVTRYEQTTYPPVSIFSTSSPTTGAFTPKETFYCSPVPNNCGTNFELTLFPSMPSIAGQVGDYFYPSNLAELATMKLGFLNYLKDGTTVCYIWK